ncbi:hypothetical protein E0Z10_g2805 [Xylaria hypoxylon]|uniref:RRM domain-containing protein n=1 Tax=Xylaria hypoxylon TaxID=37992 RepID=A0A4Z0Z329_9PEZI|nr:hypothetical protein E0Z10_g2805 [Xylaria hypoxylon]
MQISKANLQPIGALPLSRYFSQTASIAEGWKDAADIENATLQSSETESERNARAGYSIFVSNMTFDATDTHLHEAFGKYGDILSVSIGRDGRGLSRGFGFVTFGEKEAADRAVIEAHNSFWHGRRISVDHRKESSAGSKRQPRADSTPTNSLYIGNIPYEASDADLNKVFRSLDGIKDVRVAVDRNTGWPRGFAHADFHDVESATKAFEYLSQHNLAGRQLRVDYAETRRITNKPESD